LLKRRWVVSPELFGEKSTRFVIDHHSLVVRLANA